MPIVTVTRMKPRKRRFVPTFVLASLRAAGQVRRSEGFRSGRMRITGALEFWTLTVWDDARAMAAFRDSGYHLRVMPRMRLWAQEAAFAWSADVDDLPTWPEATARIVASASFGPLDHPNEDHRKQRVDPYRGRSADMTLKPARQRPRSAAR